MIDKELGQDHSESISWDLPSNSVEKGEKECFLFMAMDREISCWTEIPN